jgi:hypothetical protein
MTPELLEQTEARVSHVAVQNGIAPKIYSADYVVKTVAERCGPDATADAIKAELVSLRDSDPMHFTTSVLATPPPKKTASQRLAEANAVVPGPNATKTPTAKIDLTDPERAKLLTFSATRRLGFANERSTL